MYALYSIKIFLNNFNNVLLLKIYSVLENYNFDAGKSKSSRSRLNFKHPLFIRYFQIKCPHALKKFIQIDKKDNVLVALQDLKAGTYIETEQNSFALVDNVPAKHKFFIHDMLQGDEIIMYGVLVGKAQNFILKGSLMTTANTKHAANSYAYRNANYQWTKPDVSAFINRTFNGYLRSDGNVGTANYWLFCSHSFL